MRFTWFAKSFVLLAVFALLLPSGMLAQNVVTGGISGTVTDPSGAVVPGAKLTLKNNATGESQDATTTSTGLFNFALLKPGIYTVNIAQSGFRGVSQKVEVLLGQVIPVNIKLAVGNASETVEVTGTAPLLQTEDANISTTFTSVQIDNLPSPGGDITNYAQTAPGVLMNTQAGYGYGNFSAFGLPATSNLFTLNGNDENDPFLNLNNSGSSNLLLGQNEVQEVAVVSNGYTAQYGRQAGVQVDYSTKSGSNAFHGNANYWYDSSGFNSNEWFLKSSQIAQGEPNQQPFAVANQWAASIGGPIVKDKLFFYVDQEGLRYSLPSVGRIFLPTPAFSSYIESNIAATQPAQSAYYTNLMNIYKGSPLYGSAVPLGAGNGFDPTTFGCADFTGGGFGTAATPCLMTTEGASVNHNKEWLLTTRIDYNISSADKLFGRFKVDHGSQPTSTDLIDPVAFSTHSIQPEYEGQINETHVFSPTMVNNFIVNGLYYSAIFEPISGQSGVLSALGMSSIQFVGANLLSDLGGSTDAAGFDGGGTPDYIFPQGRNSSMYGVTDDLSITKGAHTFKMGINFRRDDFSDYDAQVLTGGLAQFGSLTDFVNGTPNIANGDIYEQVFTSAPKAPIAFYSLGLYFQDEWRVSSNLKLTLALRGDRNSNAVCQSNCFARPDQPFSLLSHNVDIPYNQTILANQHQAFPEIEKVALQPRFGFTYSPKGLSNTVLRGGIGVFSDLYQGILMDSVLENSPTTNTFVVFPNAFGTANPLAPTAANSLTSTATANNASFLGAFGSGGTLGSISAANPAFLPPNLFAIANHLDNPKYLEWNFEIQQAIGSKMSVNMNYVGTHGYNTLIQNGGLNGFLLAGSPAFGGLPVGTAPDPRFGGVTELDSTGRSNYDGLTATFTRRMSYGFQMSANYTFSHSLDDLTSTNPGTPYSEINSAVRQINPFNFDQGTYGPSDSDSRHNFTANYVWNMPHRFQNRLTELALGGWGVAGTFFAHSGVPFTAFTFEPQIDNNAGGGGPIAAFLGGGIGSGCDSPGLVNSGVPNHCISASQFAAPGPGGQSVFNNVARNYFRSPQYFDTDFTLMKNFLVTERVKLQLGANMFNVLNHPNFFSPINNVADGGAFGTLFATSVQPTTPYGAFQGAGVSGRLIQMQAKLIF
jgi:Carboxypeptidase regulatory-like domain/TonB-dependent Receptor Plug Domain